MTARSGPSTRLTPERRRLSNLTLQMSGLALCFVAVGMGVCALLALGLGEPEAAALAVGAALAGGLGVLLWRTSEAPEPLGVASVLAAVTWTWLVVSVVGAVPYVVSGALPRFDDALFESVAGFTTTGDSVFASVEDLGRGLLLWRSLTQWYGGLGMIVLAISVLPVLGVGGAELFRAESPGPTADRLAPRISETAKRLWAVYVGLTVAAAAGLVAVGMGAYDAISHALTAVATGGYSTRDASIAHFDSIGVEVVLMAAMFAGGIGFTLHWRAVRGDVGSYWASAEFRTYVGVLMAGTAAVWAANVAAGRALMGALREAAFAVVSVGSNAAFATTDWARWAPAAQLVLVVLMITGAMAGSTSGGVKLFRVQVLVKVARREVLRARHPNAVVPVKLGRHPVDDDVVARIVGFLLCWVVISATSVLVLAALGADLVTAGSGVIAAITNIGTGLGEIGPEGSSLVFSRPARLVLAALMLVGRLEIFPVLLMFTAAHRSLARRPLLRGR